MKAIMKAKVYKLLIGTVMMMAMLFTINIVSVKAANCNIAISSANGAVGETVVVNVTATPEVAAAGQIIVIYDTNYLEYQGSDSSDIGGGQAGVIQIVSTDILTSGYTVPLKFKLRQPGTTTVSVEKNTTGIYEQNEANDEPMNYNISDGAVTVTAATVASNDSKLSGLSVQAVTSNGDSSNVVYTPSFSPDVTEYKAELASNVTKLVIATTLSDSKSQTAVSGTRIDPGNNKTTVTVTAEDGSVTKYTLYTIRAVENTTEPSTSGEESTSAQDIDRTPKKIEALNKYIIQDFTLTTIPEGFEEGTTTYEGQTIAVLKGIAKPLTLMCLADDAQGANIEKYIYNEASGAIDKMVDITSMQKMYTILPTGADYPGPAGYTQTELDVKGNKVRAWVKSADSEFYVVYAMNWNGETSLYAYDTKEQTMQRFVEGNKTENIEDVPKEENTEYLLMKKQYDEMYDEYVNDHQKKNKQIVILLVAIIVIMVISTIVIYLLYKKNTTNGYAIVNDELNNEHEDDDEINLDFVEVSNGDTKSRQTNLDVALNNISKREAKDIQVLMEEENDEIGFEAAIEENKIKNNKENQVENVVGNDIKNEISKSEETTQNSKNEEVEADKVEKTENTLGSREEVKASASDILDALDTQSLKEVIEETSKVVEEDDDELEIEFFDLDD